MKIPFVLLMKTHTVNIIKTSQLHKEVIAACSESNIKHMSAFCMQDAEGLSFKPSST
jgi:hypothetical protein